jgi:hypothetical protein
VLLEVDPAIGEEIYTLWGIHVVVEGESKVELPGADGFCEVAVLVCEGNSQLDDTEEVDIASRETVSAGHN